MLTILIPCAGDGRRFREAGYDKPKPLIDVNGEPMLKRVIDNLKMSGEVQWVFVTKELHGLYTHISKWVPHSTVIQIGDTTGGAACTCLKAKAMIDNQEPLVIANCDQLIEGPKWWMEDFARLDNERDGAVLTMQGDGSKKWSYAEIEGGNITRIAEKIPIGPRATCGIYYWRRGSDFVQSASTMIELGDSVNGEYYVAPSFNHLEHSDIIHEIRIEDLGATFHGLGTPEDLEAYLRGK